MTVVTSTTSIVTVGKTPSMSDRIEVVVDIMVVPRVEDVRLRQLQAAETISQAKYTTAAGAVEHEGRGSCEEETAVDDVIMRLLETSLEEIATEVLEMLLGPSDGTGDAMLDTLTGLEGNISLLEALGKSLEGDHGIDDEG